MFSFFLLSEFWFLIGDISLLLAAIFFIPNMIWGDKGPPFVPSQRKTVKKIVVLANVKPGDKAADLGSGDGRVVIALAKAGAEVHGYEINIALIYWSRLRIILAGVFGKAFIHQQSFWDESLSSYNIVSLFGTTKIMASLNKKLDSELKPGTRIVSNTFEFPYWNYAKKESNVYLYIKN